jgi:hypothetical protein
MSKTNHTKDRWGPQVLRKGGIPAPQVKPVVLLLNDMNIIWYGACWDIRDDVCKINSYVAKILYLQITSKQQRSLVD